ncbi:MAG: hypothetical protein AAB402_04420 [Patescibacteria group bacterium]
MHNQHLNLHSDSAIWVNRGRRSTLKLFHEAAKRVPAYKNFLLQHHVRQHKIRSWQDFLQIPVMDKKNYLKKYTLAERSWDGHLRKPLVFTSTSGSTGDPTFFPRGRVLDNQYSTILEQYIRQSSYGPNEPTLVLICFGMGVWIGGLITYQAFEIAANRGGYPISILTPGINKKEIINALKILAPSFDQVIMVGYAPFIRDVVEEAKMEGVNFISMRVRFLFAAEAISEKYRDYLKSLAPRMNVYQDTLNIYGSADIGAMAYEGPAGILVKNIISRSKRTKEALIGQVLKTPTIAQFNTSYINFESLDGEIVLSGNNEVPLIRYAIGDRGGVLSYDEVSSRLLGTSVNLQHEIESKKIRPIICRQPFVYVYERSDFSTTLYGINIYPEFVRDALLQQPIRSKTTGKFTLVTNHDKKQNQYLQVNVELIKNVKRSKQLEYKTLGVIQRYLSKRSSEFRELVQFVKNKKILQVALWPSAHPTYFRPGVKQKWVINKKS